MTQKFRSIKLGIPDLGKYKRLGCACNWARTKALLDITIPRLGLPLAYYLLTKTRFDDDCINCRFKLPMDHEWEYKINDDYVPYDCRHQIIPRIAINFFKPRNYVKEIDAKKQKRLNQKARPKNLNIAKK